MQLFGLSVLRGKVCFLQEYCEMSLYEMITQDVLQEQLAWRFLKQIIEAVAHLHSLKCHHGNINCEQVLVVHNSCKVKIPLMEVPQKDDEL